LRSVVLMATQRCNKRDGEFEDRDEFHKYTRVISIVLESNKDMRERLLLMDADLSNCNASLCTTRVDAAYYKQLAGELLVERDALVIKCNQCMDAAYYKQLAGELLVERDALVIKCNQRMDVSKEVEVVQKETDATDALMQDTVHSESVKSDATDALVQDTVHSESVKSDATDALVPDTMDPEISKEIVAPKFVNCFESESKQSNHSRVKLSKTFQLLDDAVACISEGINKENVLECKYSENVASLERANAHIKLLTNENALIIREKADTMDLYNAIKNSFGTPSNNYCTSLFRSADGSANDVIRRMLVDKVSQIEKLKEVIF
jgi:hypothetical protein